MSLLPPDVNPKVSIFFLAFLPQFTQPDDGPPIVQSLWQGMLFILATTFIFGGIALMAGKFGARLQQSTRMQRRLNRFAAAVLWYCWPCTCFFPMREPR